MKIVSSENTELGGESVTKAAGGEVSVTAGGDALFQAGSLVDVSASDLVAAAGSVNVGGDRVGLAGEILANDAGEGAGKVTVDSIGRTAILGSIEAKGGGEVRINQPGADGLGDSSTVMYQGSIINTLGGNDNGFVEVSGATMDVNSGVIRAGTILFDPENIFFVTSADSGGLEANVDATGLQELFNDDVGENVNFNVTGTGVIATVGDGGTLVFEANADISLNTNFNVLTATGDNNVSLTLRARNNINFSSNILTLTGTGALVLHADANTDQSGTSDDGVGSITSNSGAAIITAGGDVDLKSSGEATLPSLTTTGGNITVENFNNQITTRAINSGGGNVTIKADTSGQNNSLLFLGLSLTSSDGGAGIGGDIILEAAGSIQVAAIGTNNITTDGGSLALIADTDINGSGQITIPSQASTNEIITSELNGSNENGGDVTMIASEITLSGVVDLAGTGGGANGRVFIGNANPQGRIGVGVVVSSEPDANLDLSEATINVFSNFSAMRVGTFTTAQGAQRNHTQNADIVLGVANLGATVVIIDNTGGDGGIINDAATTLFRADQLTLRSGEGIGTAADPLDINASSDTFDLLTEGVGSNGDIFLTETSVGGNIETRLTAFDPDNDDVANITTDAGSDQLVFIQNDVSGNITNNGDNIRFTDNLVLQTDRINLDAVLDMNGDNSLTIQQHTNDRTLTLGTKVNGTLGLTDLELTRIANVDDLILGRGADGNFDGGLVNITADITLPGNDNFILAGDTFAIVNTGTFNITTTPTGGAAGGGNIGFSAGTNVGTAGNNILITSNLLVAESRGTGNIFIVEIDAAANDNVDVNNVTVTFSGRASENFTLTGAVTNDGAIDIRSANGDLTISEQVIAGGAGQNATLVAGGVFDLILDANVTADGDLAELQAGQDILQAANSDFVNAANAVFLAGRSIGTNNGDAAIDLNVTNVAADSGRAGNANGTNDIFLNQDAAGGNLTVNSIVSALAGTGIDGTQVDVGAAGSTNGTIEILTEDDDLIVSQEVNAKGDGHIFLNVKGSGDTFRHTSNNIDSNSNGNIRIKADRVQLAGGNIGNANERITIEPEDLTVHISLGNADDANDLTLSDAELDTIDLNGGSGVLIIGQVNHTGNISIAGDINVDGDVDNVLHLITNGSVIGGNINANDLAITANADVNVDVLVDDVAIVFQSLGAFEVNLREGDDGNLNITNVDGVVGIQQTTGNITITMAGSNSTLSVVENIGTESGAGGNASSITITAGGQNTTFNVVDSTANLSIATNNGLIELAGDDFTIGTNNVSISSGTTNTILHAATTTRGILLSDAETSDVGNVELDQAELGVIRAATLVIGDENTNANITISNGDVNISGGNTTNLALRTLQDITSDAAGR
ncbi:MAG: hypothetical protein O2857_14330, partial [Planctomycetota bacterium]|nr:hypothetical protein [Planctomycetota bacterium]